MAACLLHAEDYVVRFRSMVETLESALHLNQPLDRVVDAMKEKALRLQAEIENLRAETDATARLLDQVLLSVSDFAVLLTRPTVPGVAASGAREPVAGDSVPFAGEVGAGVSVERGAASLDEGRSCGLQRVGPRSGRAHVHHEHACGAQTTLSQGADARKDHPARHDGSVGGWIALCLRL